ncbi:agmatine deiminase [Candidatus Endolissoclinum faulkneri L5]|uniref:Putative agmatine deiminase n=1 Tax=Candidatus Endolissoclinum faulkneri L5 TaxID=1401328 RepID=V9TSP5_9PROT|nr:agmatine deiminase [Candidatus Endolissoclinum faulkneri]AHC73944.1 agmatine deiminase [Candidatus Endolissoclinum faulkneri L5]
MTKLLDRTVDLLQSTPVEDNYWMPGEFEPHSGTWMLWPERSDNWRKDAMPAEESFAAVAEAIVSVESLKIGVSARKLARAKSTLPSEVSLVVMESNDAWMRDVGPTILINNKGSKRAVDWMFNAWGGVAHGLYQDWQADDAVAAIVAKNEGMDRYRAPLVQEGGGIHSDGKGTIFVTEECVLSNGRNAKLGYRLCEEILKSYSGASQVIWLPRGVYADETTGHIDNLLHVAGPNLIFLTWTDDPYDEQYVRSARALSILDNTRDINGNPFHIIKLPAPGPLHRTAYEASGIASRPGSKSRKAGDRLAGSYVNFYLANGRALVPLLDPRTDDNACLIIADALPNREIIPIPAREILIGGGNIHCITQQIPL